MTEQVTRQNLLTTRHRNTPMTWLKLALSAVVVITAICAPWGHAVAQEVKTVPTVDLSRYAGTWYEIAKFPNNFQKKCVRNITSEYQLADDGTIKIINRCYTENSANEVAEGQARVTDRRSNARLQVRFAPAWMAWLPMVWGDYWIIDLDKDYTVAVVGSPSRDYLWILSRTPELPVAQYEMAVNNATRQGFDTSKLVKTLQVH